MIMHSSLDSPILDDDDDCACASRRGVRHLRHVCEDLPMQVSWMNHIMKTLWPHMNQAIGKMILETVEPMIADVQKQVGFANN